MSQTRTIPTQACTHCVPRDGTPQSESGKTEERYPYLEELTQEAVEAPAPRRIRNAADGPHNGGQEQRFKQLIGYKRKENEERFAYFPKLMRLAERW